METSDKRKAQQKEASANYRAKMKAYIAELLVVIAELKRELSSYRDK